MKKITTSFNAQYPYLSYWVKHGGWMQLGYNESTEGETFLMLTDEDDIVYEAEEEDTIDEAFQKAEKYLREVDFPERFDKETIADLEKNYPKHN